MREKLFLVVGEEVHVKKSMVTYIKCTNKFVKLLTKLLDDIIKFAFIINLNFWINW